MNRLIVLFLLLSVLFSGRDANAQAVVVDVSTNVFLTPTTFPGPQHTSVMTVRFENLLGTIPVGGIRVTANVDNHIEILGLNISSPASFSVEFSNSLNINLLNTVPIAPGDTPIDILINVRAVTTGSNIPVIANTEIADPDNVTENNTGNNGSNTTTSVGTSALPVTLASFNAKAVNKHAVLEWVTSSEKNNAFFEVQHSTNARDFDVLGKVDGHGTTYENHSYRFTQEYPDPAVVHYYRLRQVDTDGKFEYSFIRSLTFDGYVGIELKLATNPVTNGTIKAFVDYGDENLSNQANLVLIDNMGRTVSKQTVMLDKGRNTVLFQGVALHSGLYVISLQNTSLLQPKVVKVAVQ